MSKTTATPKISANSGSHLHIQKLHITNLHNYSFTSLLQQIYKVLNRFIANPLSNKIDTNQSIDQDGFLSGCNTCGHLQPGKML